MYMHVSCLSAFNTVRSGTPIDFYNCVCAYLARARARVCVCVCVCVCVKMMMSEVCGIDFC